MSSRRSLFQLWQAEFAHYDRHIFRQDLLAGLTVGAVALPLALAFGVVSGASAAAGLVTAILSGLVIGALSGAPYQISGPTGAMSAILILLAQKYGVTGVWIAGVMAGALLLVVGLLRVGRFIAFIPAPVVSGFTSGIALIIAIGQIDNVLGVKTPGAESAALKLAGYVRASFRPDWHAILLGCVVAGTMLAWPRRWASRLPASLLGIALATALSVALGWQVAIIGAIPQTLLLADRLHVGAIPWQSLPDFIAPALSITALAGVESLLCGAVGSNMTGIRMQANQELIAQGVGNLVIPFFGGVPATAAIARSSVGIKSGGRTRMVSFVHAGVLLLSMFVFAPVMSRVPLAALAGVLIVTAWRMNEWDAIRYMLRHRLKTALLTFAVTLLATVTLDLTQAILIGVVVSAAVFLSQAANMQITVDPVDPTKLAARGVTAAANWADVRVVYLSGPLFFAATGSFHEAIAARGPAHTLVLSMRGVPLIDSSGLQALSELAQQLRAAGGLLLLAGVQPAVQTMLERGGLVAELGAANFFWSTDLALAALAQGLPVPLPPALPLRTAAGAVPASA